MIALFWGSMIVNVNTLIMENSDHSIGNSYDCHVLQIKAV